MSRRFLGLDLTAEEIRAVALQRQHRSPRLAAVRVSALPSGVLRPSPRSPNIADRARFEMVLRDVLDPLSAREERIAVSLPDAAGRLLLCESEAPFKNREEGEEILRWQLKNSLPEEGEGVRLDFQVLGRREDGRTQLAVSAMATEVLEQYEDAFAAAGYHPAVIDFHSLHLYNYYRPRLDLGGDFILVSVEGGNVTLQYYENHRLAYFRSREVGMDSLAMFRELRRTLVGAVSACPGLKRADVYAHSDWPDREEVAAALAGLFEREVNWLNPNLQRLAGASLELPGLQVNRLTAAVGAAERFF